MFYGFICDSCDDYVEFMCRIKDYESIDRVCKRCGGELKRDFTGQQVIPPIMEHFNLSLGKVIKGRNHWREEMKAFDENKRKDNLRARKQIQEEERIARRAQRPVKKLYFT